MSKIQKTEQKVTAVSLQAQITQLIGFLKSLQTSLPKQGRRLLTISNLQKNKTMQKYYNDQKINFTLNEFEDYSNLLSKQSKENIHAVFVKVEELNLKLKTKLTRQKRGTQKIDVTEEASHFKGLKKMFEEVWKEEYFLILNYRMAITAKELERWTEVASSSVTPSEVQAQVDDLFL